MIFGKMTKGDWARAYEDTGTETIKEMEAFFKGLLDVKKKKALKIIKRMTKEKLREIRKEAKRERLAVIVSRRVLEAKLRESYGAEK